MARELIVAVESITGRSPTDTGKGMAAIIGSLVDSLQNFDGIYHRQGVRAKEGYKHIFYTAGNCLPTGDGTDGDGCSENGPL